MRGLAEHLRALAGGGLLPWPAQVELAGRFGLGLGEVERAALRAGILPARYQRNRRTVSVEEQLRLREARVAVVGCGGLGGYLVEELARLGVGTLVAIDPDVFEEHNLNRQLLSTPARLGQAKVVAARERAAVVNPAVEVVTHQERLGAGNGAALLAGCSAAVDGLDGMQARRELAAVCREKGIPFVHGAIAGWYGQVAVQLPGEDLGPLFQAEAGEKGVERELGNPAFTPAVVASLQVAEVAKVLLGRGQPLSGRILRLDLLAMAFAEVPGAGR